MANENNNNKIICSENYANEKKKYVANNTLATIENELEKNTLSIFGSSNVMDRIITRGAEEKIAELKILSTNQLAEISENISEINRATTPFGRSQSGYMNYMMTVSAYTPVRNARQILAEIESRRQALKENIFKQKRSKGGN